MDPRFPQTPPQKHQPLSFGSCLFRGICIRAKFHQLATSAGQLATSAGQLATSAGQLATSAGQLATSAGQLATSAGQLATSAGQLATSAGQLATSAGQLATSAGQLATSAGQLATSAGQLATSAGQLATSAGQLATSAGQLATSAGQLATSAGAFDKPQPEYTPAMPSDPPARPRGESEAHRALKRSTLLWAQRQGFVVAAPEVSLPSYRVRADAAAYRPARARVSMIGKNGRPRTVSKPALGTTAVFECKVSKPDFRRDARSMQATSDSLRRLHEKKARIEDELRVFYPSIRNGDSLFSEFETLNFERPGYERYQAVLNSISQLTARLYDNTKFERLTAAAMANLYYVVADPGVLALHELPAGWGYLEMREGELHLVVKPVWHSAADDARLEFLTRIALAGTRATNRENNIAMTDRGQFELT